MRILHSSDWHLGISQGAASRAPDHDLFLDWLRAQIVEHSVDALIVAGDIFDSLQPPAEAQRRLYQFLASLTETGLPQVVLVGGNHDSAARLDAPEAVLGALDVAVVGGIGATEESWERCLVPLRDRSGAVAGVCLAVPYVHEFRLGVRTTDLDRAASRAAFQDRFAALYRWLADTAQARWPGVPLVATGHLNLGRPREEDYPQPIHQVGNLDGLPDTVIDPRIAYLALGHIHRCYPVDEARRAWYSGSPIPLALPEAKTARNVLLVDILDEDQIPTVTRLAVPGFRALEELRGSPDELLAALPALRWDQPLPPLLFLRVVADLMPSGLSARLHEALAAHPEDARPAVVELRQERATPLPADEEPSLPALEALQPAEVFATLLRARGVHDTAALESAFAQLLSASDEDLGLPASGGAR